MPDKPRYINAGGKLIDLSVPRIMGIINVTPDSFFRGSRYQSQEEIIGAAAGMIRDGADIIDVGGYSSRPGAEDISAETEKERVLAAIRLIKKEFPEAVISVDTFRADIAREAVIDCGASIINDVTGGEGDRGMFDMIEKLNVPYVLMHMQGNPRTMQVKPEYGNVVADILKWLGERIYRLRSAGVKDIIVDPGLGFGKTIEHNFEILRCLGDFRIAGMPVLVGVSRKSMIWKTLGISPDESLNGTTVLNTVALLNGADIIRVHDVKQAAEAVRLVSGIVERIT
ncbi:MAG: dihydropteroate synthase [Bacteroidales bacterium]|nr:dihydropteroate synthase [Bacteroidales bacterium]